jgi:hypothetical protein
MSKEHYSDRVEWHQRAVSSPAAADPTMLRAGLNSRLCTITGQTGHNILVKVYLSENKIRKLTFFESWVTTVSDLLPDVSHRV